MTRSLEHWRSLPLLRISEAAVITGVCPRVFEEHVMPKLQTRTVGRVRFVTTDSYRAWLGEDVATPAESAHALSTINRRLEAR